MVAGATALPGVLSGSLGVNGSPADSQAVRRRPDACWALFHQVSWGIGFGGRNTGARLSIRTSSVAGAGWPELFAPLLVIWVKRRDALGTTASPSGERRVPPVRTSRTTTGPRRQEDGAPGGGPALFCSFRARVGFGGRCEVRLRLGCSPCGGSGEEGRASCSFLRRRRGASPAMACQPSAPGCPVFALPEEPRALFQVQEVPRRPLTEEKRRINCVPGSPGLLGRVGVFRTGSSVILV